MKNTFSKSLARGVVGLSVLAATACVSDDGIVKKDVDFISNPDEATVFINGENYGLTPLRVSLPVDGSYSVRFSKPGFFDEEFLVEPTTDARGNANLARRVEISLRRAADEPAAAEISSRSTPVDFTEFRLREKEIRDLLQNGKISEEEGLALLEKLRADYDSFLNAGTPQSSSSKKNFQ